MLLDHHRPHTFHVQKIVAEQARVAVEEARRSAERLWGEESGVDAYAVHLSDDRTRVVTVEAWRDAEAYRRARRTGGSVLYEWAATGGVDPTPVADITAGVIIIDTFRVWRPLLRPVAAFNIRNGSAFNREPGCISTTVLRGIDAGMIATYARWASVEAFSEAFARITGKPARSPADVNRAAARMTMGLIRPDYHSYELVAHAGAQS